MHEKSDRHRKNLRRLSKPNIGANFLYGGTMKKVTIYTDGACSGNPGDGGWGAVLKHGDAIREISGYEKDTTNNRMELKAVVEALKCLKESCDIELFSDSAYVVNAFNNGWIENWQKNGWRNAGKKPVKNKDLWTELIELADKNKIKWLKVKGHADDEYNNRCDELATSAIIYLRNKEFE